MPDVIRIDRSRPFDLAVFLGQYWSIVEEDERSIALTEVDLTAIRLLEHGHDNEERWVTGEERLVRLKAAGHIRLDLRIFQTFWENQDLIPEEWKEETKGGTPFVRFEGTILKPRNDHRRGLYLYWRDNQGCWDWNTGPLRSGYGPRHKSAVLAT